MTVISVDPFVLTDVKMKIGADNFEAALSEVRFVPTAGQITWKGLTPASVFTRAQKATWVCQISYAQDHDTAGSLSTYLHDNEGSTVAAEFVPVNGPIGSTKFSANVTITPGPIGGAVDEFGVGTVSLGSDKPVKGVTT